MPRSNHEYVFVRPCGCAVDMVIHRMPVLDEGSAWRQVFGSAQGAREARLAGIRCVQVDHDTFLRQYAKSMYEGCTHRAVKAK